MDKTNTALMCATAALMTVLLTACGGGSDPNAAGSDGAVASETVPGDASASAAGMARWMATLAATSGETQEPLDTTRFNPPAPDDSEPEAVN